MGASQRLKGHGFERKIASVLRLVWYDARRGLDQTRDGKESDIEGTPLRIECKKRKDTREVKAALAQAARDAKRHSDARPLCAITAIDYEEPWVTMPLTDFLRFVTEHLQRKVDDDAPDR